MGRTAPCGPVLAVALCWMLLACGGPPAASQADRAATPSPSAAGQERTTEGGARRDTETVERYKRGELLTAQFDCAWTGEMDGYTFHTHRFEGDRVTGVEYDWAGEAKCRLVNDEVVDCAGELTGLEISFRLEYTPVADGPYLYYLVRHEDPTNPDYSLDLFFPREFLVLTTTIQPAVQERGHLRWVEPEMHRFEVQVTFHDRRLLWLRWLLVAGLGLLMGILGYAWRSGRSAA